MFGRRSKRATPAAPDTRTRGMRMTEKFLPIFGPAQVGSSTAPVRPPSEAEVSRDATLRTELVRVVGPDGSSYVVSAPVTSAGDPPAPAGTSAVGTAPAADPASDEPGAF